MKRGFAIALAYLALLLIPVGLGAVLIPSLVGQIEDLADNVPEYAQDVTEFVQDNETLNDLNEKYDFTSEIQSAADDLPSRIGDAAGVLQDIGVGVVNSIFAGVTILILSDLHGRRRAALGGGVRALAAARAGGAHRPRPAPHRDAIGNYVGGALVQATIAGGERVHRAHDPRRAVRRRRWRWSSPSST